MPETPIQTEARTALPELLAEVERLTKVAEDACDYANFQVVTLKQGDTYQGIHKYRYGDEVVIVGGYVPGEVICRTDESPELAAYLKEQDGR